IQKRRMHDSCARLAVYRKGHRNAYVRMPMRVIRGPINRIDDPYMIREIETPFDDNLLAQKPMLWKPGSQILANDLIRAQIRGADELSSMLLPPFNLPQTRPLDDKRSRLCHGRDGFV